MSLNYGICIKGANQSGRKVRFVVDYKSLPFEPSVSGAMLSRFGFVHSIPKKRFSILVDSTKTFRCEFTTKLVTDDPIAEVFYNDVLNANQTSLFTGEMLKPFFTYYVMDDAGTDIPLIPNIDDFKTSTGANAIKESFSSLLLPIALVAGAYFGYPYYKEIFKSKRKK